MENRHEKYGKSNCGMDISKTKCVKRYLLDDVFTEMLKGVEIGNNKRTSSNKKITNDVTPDTTRLHSNLGNQHNLGDVQTHSDVIQISNKNLFHNVKNKKKKNSFGGSFDNCDESKSNSISKPIFKTRKLKFNMSLHDGREKKAKVSSGKNLNKVTNIKKRKKVKNKSKVGLLQQKENICVRNKPTSIPTISLPNSGIHFKSIESENNNTNDSLLFDSDLNKSDSFVESLDEVKCRKIRTSSNKRIKELSISGIVKHKKNKLRSNSHDKYNTSISNPEFLTECVKNKKRKISLDDSPHFETSIISSSFEEPCSSGWIQIENFAEEYLVPEDKGTYKKKSCKNKYVCRKNLESMSEAVNENLSRSSLSNNDFSCEDDDMVELQGENEFNSSVNASDLTSNNPKLNSSSNSLKEFMQSNPECIRISKIDDGKVLVLMKSQSSMRIEGIVGITVYKGGLEILGFMSVLGSKLSVFSLRGFGLMDLKCYECEQDSDKFSSDTLIDLGIDSSVLDNIENYECVFILERINSLMASAISIQIPIELYPAIKIRSSRDVLTTEEEELQCQFSNLKLEYKNCEMSTCWDNLAKEFASLTNQNFHQRIMVTGGKGVGKSTFLKFLINRSLQIFEKIVYLDLDPGQPEFSVPGSISAVVVNKPLLGPNFTHSSTLERTLFVSTVNIAECASHYLECVNKIYEFCESNDKYRNVPWFINTMGFSRGLGIEVIINTIRTVLPTWVIQIQSLKKKKLNYPFILSSFSVATYQNSFGKPPCESENISYKLTVMNSAVDNQDVPRLQPKLLREIMILSYFNKNIKPPSYSILDMKPFIINLSSLKLGYKDRTFPPNQILKVMNGNLVALFKYDGEPVLSNSDKNLPEILTVLPLSPCLGFGIVRGIDLDSSTIYLLTPIKLESMQEIYCLVAGTVNVPSCIYMNVQESGNEVPYVVSGEMQPTSKIARRALKQRRIYNSV